MQVIRFKDAKDKIQYGWIDQEKVGLIDGDIFGEHQRVEPTLNLSNITVLSPIKPEKIICIGRNYFEHVKEQNAELPESPLIFLKPSSAIIGNSVAIVLPPQSNQVEHEAELVVVIGKEGKWISVDKATDFIFGYTIGNDITARDLQHKDLQWTRAKGFDTFCPVGPWIETELDPADCLITCRVNDELRQMGSTREMVFSVNQVIAYISTIMTLKPGDAIFTGTPAGVGPIRHGDRVEITIEGIGKLFNPVD